MNDLDQLDRKLVALLREDGRAPIARLAAELKVSRATVDMRLRRLLQRGVLLGFSARVRDSHGDGVVRAMMLIEVAGRSQAQVIRSLRGLPEVHAIHTTNGRWDLVAEIVAPSLADFDRTLEQIRDVSGVAGSQTSLLLTSVS
jgi:DNA-binding Lrp family transcriptional regulator